MTVTLIYTIRIQMHGEADLVFISDSTFHSDIVPN